MSEWRTEHAEQVRTAYDVLRSSSEAGSPAEVLYRDWYAVRSPHAVPHARWSAPLAGTARASHGDTDHWSMDEFDVVGTGIAGVVVVATHHGRRALCRGEYVTTHGRPGFPPRVGDRVRTIDRIGAATQEGWWRTRGAGWDPRVVPEHVVRVYLRPDAGAVGHVVNAVTSALAETDTWLLKVAVAPDQLERPDACVVYLAGSSRDRLRYVVADAVAGYTAGEPPPLTERLGDGVGWAEDPGTGESFGEVRCAAIATAYERFGDAVRVGGRLIDLAWLEVVAHEFRCRRIEPASPHLSPVLVGAST